VFKKYEEKLKKEEQEDEEEQEFKVEQVLNEKVDKKGNVKYLVKWENYDDSW
jgi:hypothetical protein